jgi:hypothetical protein
MAKGIKTGGRQKGTPNKLTSEVRTVLKDIVHDEIAYLPELLKNLEPKERLQVLIKILPFVIPKVETIPADTGEAFQWNQIH